MVSKSKRRSPGSKAAVTYLNAEGACAAALFLLDANDQVFLYPSSAHGIGRALHEVAGERFAEVHICGVGVKCPEEEALAGLRAVRDSGARVVWHCGWDYLNALRSRIEELAQCNFLEGRGTFGAVTDYLFGRKKLSERARFLQRVVEASELGEVKGSKPAPESPAWWAEMVRAAVWRELNFRDHEAFPRVVRALAGAGSLTDRDTDMLESCRRMRGRVLEGKSDAILRVREAIARFAPRRSTVLITGETGTGKEIVARLVHEESPRAGERFVAVNCATLSGSLLEDMLFGHEKGAFTDAKEGRTGCFEEADGGTLFLDEVGEVPPETQAKLLRVLQEGRLRRLGGSSDIEVDVRLIAATNRDLLGEVRVGRFRSDLYYRLNVLHIGLPPLRARPGDISILVRQILRRLCDEEDAPRPRMGKQQLQVLENHPWPGNVRELENVLERAVALGSNNIRTLLDPAPAGSALAATEEILPLRDMEVRYVQKVYERCGQNIAQTAKALGVARNTLKQKLSRS